jgi:hypothetical protein
VGLDDGLVAGSGERKRVVETYHPANAQFDLPMRPNPTAMWAVPGGRFPPTLSSPSLAEDVATPIGAVEAYDLSSLQRQRVAALLEMMRRAVDVNG